MKLVFHRKTVNKYGGASYKAVNSRSTGTIYCSPKTFSGEPPDVLEIESDLLADPTAVAASESTAEARAAKAAEREALKAKKAEERAAAKAAKLADREAAKAKLAEEREAKRAAKAAERAAMLAAGKAAAVPADAPALS